MHTCCLLCRFNDNVKKVWATSFSCSKTLRDVQEFFLCIYPHTQCGGARRLVKVFQRGEQAASGGHGDPDTGDAVESDGEDDPDQDGAETHSSSTANAAADYAYGTVSETESSSSSSVEASPLDDDDVDCDAAGEGSSRGALKGRSKQLVVQSNYRVVGVKAAAAGVGSRRGSTAQSSTGRDKDGGPTDEGGRHLRRRRSSNRDSPPPSDSLGVSTGRRTSRKRKA